jgi:hypothetical protein
MQIHDAKEAFVIVLQRHPIFKRTQVITEMQIAGRLRTTKDSLGHVLGNGRSGTAPLLNSQEK